jgi:hypothetical protein
MARTSHDAVSVQHAPEVVHSTSAVHDAEKSDIAKVERVLSATENEKSDHMNYDRVDAEISKYAGAVAIEISEEENKRLKRMIDTRVLPIMVFTYFLQALDKGTMSFTAIMGIRADIPILADNSKVCLFSTGRMFCILFLWNSWRDVAITYRVIQI